MSIEQNPIVRFMGAQPGDRVIVHFEGEVTARRRHAQLLGGDVLSVVLEMPHGGRYLVNVPADQVWLAKPTPEMLKQGMADDAPD